MSTAPVTMPTPARLGDRLRRLAIRCHQAAAAAEAVCEALGQPDSGPRERDRSSWLADVAEEFAKEVADELDELATEHGG